MTFDISLKTCVLHRMRPRTVLGGNRAPAEPLCVCADLLQRKCSFPARASPRAPHPQWFATWPPPFQTRAKAACAEPRTAPVAHSRCGPGRASGLVCRAPRRCRVAVWPCAQDHEEGLQREDPATPVPPPTAFLGRVLQAAKPGEVRVRTKEPPTPHDTAFAGLSALLIHDCNFHLPHARQGRERPISQLTRLKGRRAAGGGGGSSLKLVCGNHLLKTDPHSLSFPPGLHSSHTVGHAFQTRAIRGLGTLTPCGGRGGGTGRPPARSAPSSVAESGIPEARTSVQKRIPL